MWWNVYSMELFVSEKYPVLPFKQAKPRQIYKTRQKDNRNLGSKESRRAFNQLDGVSRK